MVVIAYATSKDSVESANSYILSRTCAVRSVSGRPIENFNQRTRDLSLLMDLLVH